MKHIIMDQQSNVCGKLKCTLSSLLELSGMMPEIKTTLKHVVWNESDFACSFQASKHTYLLNLLLILPAA